MPDTKNSSPETDLKRPPDGPDASSAPEEEPNQPTVQQPGSDLFPEENANPKDGKENG